MVATWRMPDLPFFDESHTELGERLTEWVKGAAEPEETGSPYFADECKTIAKEMAEWGFLDYAVPAEGGLNSKIDVRALSLIREALAYRSGLVDSVFVMQGLATAPLWLTGSDELCSTYLEPARQGQKIAAFAVTEPEAGSDVAALKTTAERDGDHFILNGHKRWITNAGAADFYIVIARTGEAPGSRGLSAFMVDADTDGLEIGPEVEMIAPHPIGEVIFRNCRVPATNMIGAPGEGFKAAMKTFDIFRTSVGAAALGMARRALAETIGHTKSRELFGGPLAQMPTVQATLADMALDVETSSLLVYRSAWLKDVHEGRHSGAVAMAKLGATEAAHRVADNAVQLFGALGVARGSTVEQIYREIRPLRIYEGASEVQKVIIARSLLQS
ncbi:acyl-CoA dehydrogenase family protein [Marinobacter sp. F3R11]|uniref:acyl-CoA dehydrogenase family protein n=1 Tax=Marinobacter sp. F3R11 TaxID=2267231 RepID=UPI000DE84D5D|nr:acyl-CoA dehydrogenase [Marinobacter sp. F3R11]RBW51210.1 acyl-CoA dehydrogenase [Marinobacter sp. F3R11]